MKNTVKKAVAILLAVSMQTNLLSAGYAAEVSDATENEGVTNAAVTTVIYDTDIAAGTKAEITSLPDFTVSAIPEDSGELAIGDINGDNEVDLTDLSELSLAFLRDKTLTENQLKAADINENGKSDLTDLARMKQYVSKVITSLRN